MPVLALPATACLLPHTHCCNTMVRCVCRCHAHTHTALHPHHLPHCPTHHTCHVVVQCYGRSRTGPHTAATPQTCLDSTTSQFESHPTPHTTHLPHTRHTLPALPHHLPAHHAPPHLPPRTAFPPPPALRDMTGLGGTRVVGLLHTHHTFRFTLLHARCCSSRTAHFTMHCH